MSQKIERVLLLFVCLALVYCSFLDGWSTHLFLTLGNTYEANPLFSRHPSEWRLWIEGSAIIAVEILFAWRVSRRRPQLMGWFIVALLVQIAVHLYCYYTNNAFYVTHR